MNTCKICDLEKEDVKLRLDPYMEDIFNKKVEKYLCDFCYHLMQQEI